MEGSGIWTMVLCKLQQKSFEERSSLQDASYGEFCTALFVQCGLVLANVIHHQELAIERPTSESEVSATSESEAAHRHGVPEPWEERWTDCAAPWHAGRGGKDGSEGGRDTLCCLDRGSMMIF